MGLLLHSQKSRGCTQQNLAFILLCFTTHCLSKFLIKQLVSSASAAGFRMVGKHL